MCVPVFSVLFACDSGNEVCYSVFGYLKVLSFVFLKPGSFFVHWCHLFQIRLGYLVNLCFRISLLVSQDMKVYCCGSGYLKFGFCLLLYCECFQFCLLVFQEMKYVLLFYHMKF